VPRCGPPGGGTPTTTGTSRRGPPRPLPAGQVIGCVHRPTASSTPTPSAATSSSASLARATTSRRIRSASPCRTPRRSPVMITTPTVSGKPGQAPTGISCDLYPLIGSHSTWTDPRGPVTATVYGINLLLAMSMVSVRWRYAVHLRLVRPDLGDQDVKTLQTAHPHPGRLCGDDPAGALPAGSRRARLSGHRGVHPRTVQCTTAPDTTRLTTTGLTVQAQGECEQKWRSEVGASRKPQVGDWL
jgi:hypothetical protein